MQRVVSVSFLFLFLLFSKTTWAFPEMIRMGYVNCTACHVSPTGGGLLTQYGRAASTEVLSTWSYKNEELAGHGIAPAPPEWLNVGGDFRSIQTYMDTPVATSSSFFPMQADVEVGLTAGKFTYVQTLGVQGGPEGAPFKGELIAHRMYALYNWTEELYTRAGKYFMPYGIPLPDHNSYVRRNLGFNENQETYNFDVGYVGEAWNAILAMNFGRKDQVTTELDKGASLEVGANIGDSHKVMGNFAYLKNTNMHRYLAGPSILWGFSAKWVFLGEYDYQEKSMEGAASSVQKGAVTYSRLQYEWMKGVNTYLLHQLSYLDFTQLRTRVNSLGFGVLWYPRPHFEFSVEFDSALTADINETNNIAWGLIHYYL
jgi:hypothetical protein